MAKARRQLAQSRTGIHGLDQITSGAGCGETLLDMVFLRRCATQCNHPGLVIAFEQAARDLFEGLTSLGRGAI